MADTKISGLTDGVTANATDEIPAARAGANVKITPAYLKTYMFSSGTITTSQPVSIAQTWNAVGVTFSALQVNVTDTQSASGSLLADLQVGGTSKFKVSKAGDLTLGSGTGTTAFTGAATTTFTANATAIFTIDNSGSSTARFYPTNNNAADLGVSSRQWGTGYFFTAVHISQAAVPAGGTAGMGVKFSSTANFGVFFGSGAPTLSAAQGSIYLRTDGSTTNNRMYVNTNGSTTWTAVTTAA